MSKLPLVFQTENLSYEDRYWIYQSKILGDCSIDQVSARIKKYVAQNVEPGCWKAVWRSKKNKQPFDVLVEVNDLDVDKLSACITFCEPVVCHPVLPIEDLKRMLLQKGNAVPLTELFIAYDESGDSDDTALAIEHIRFFYDHLWREWDEDEDDDTGCSFSSHYLQPRLRLYYDIQNGLLPKELVKKYQDNYSEYKQRLAELEALRSQMAASDSEQELDDLDVLKCATMIEECNTLMHSLQMMENPQMRYLLAAVSPGAKASLCKPKGQRPDGQPPYTIIVANKLIANMVKSLSDDQVLEHYDDLNNALEGYFHGDTIHLYPGRYCLEQTVNLTDPVKIIGFGDSDRVVVSSQLKEDFIIECHSPGILFQNIMFEQHGGGGLLAIHSGETTLADCQLKCGATGVTVLKHGHLVMENCKLYDAKSAGVNAQSEGKVHIQNCEFSNCGENLLDSSAAVQLQQDSDNQPNATLLDNNIHNNIGYGVCVVRSVRKRDDNPECAVNLDVTSNRFRGNVFGDVGHIYLDESYNE